MNSYFVISLDFELFWGVHDRPNISDYKGNILNVHKVVPRILELFKKYEVACTWATVGLMMFDNKDAILKNLPERIPEYAISKYNIYPGLSKTCDEHQDELLLGKNLVSLISKVENQEVGSHTFSHYYTLESGASLASFDADCNAFNLVFSDEGESPKSIVFPRNQVNEDFLEVVQKSGIRSYRGVEKSWMYQSETRESNKSTLKRMGRLIDTYSNFSGHHTYQLPKVENGLVNIPSSRFLKPFNGKSGLLEKLKIRRIKKSMRYASQNNEIFHLWWHPHNFGCFMEENLQQLEDILKFYKFLNMDSGMQSMNMAQISQKVRNDQS